MLEPTIRPQNALLLIAVQSGPGAPATPDPTLHAISFEADSFTKGQPWGSEDVNEATGSYVAGAPMRIGQEVPLSFRSRIRGAGPNVTYTSSVKPPLHVALQVAGWRGQFTAAITAAALTAGSTTSATLGTGFGTTAQAYRGMPLAITAGVGNGRIPLISDYTTGKVATLVDLFGATLDTTTTAGIPANWTYARTSPADATARETDHPLATVYYYEDGNLYKWQDVRGVLDMEGQTARPGMGTFNMSGTYLGSETAAMPANAVVASHSAPVLAKGVGGVNGAALVNRAEVAISRWALRTGGDLEGVVDPNTPYGFGASEIVGRAPTFEADPLRTLVSTRDAIAQIANDEEHIIALRHGSIVGNRWGLISPKSKPITATDEMRGRLRADAMVWRALNPGRDNQGRDGDAILTFF
ncbi:hypothetical protein M9978_16420 [Sphingomonas sp. MG17]|uniref:Uncharacterized protein n=1 Tax=Sphingomonas tagetis TaxID=2949092 RepID=A0A9X2KMZ6_9SPHN|nr:hypothetical protein [Sphingomonas tagetis]MCP3732011.1 hypothetical protein [Sphingomonas tagetis]